MSKKKLSEKLCVAARTGNFVKCGDLIVKGANPNYQVRERFIHLHPSVVAGVK